MTPSPTTGPDALLCDECRPRLRAALWQLTGTDRDGHAYRALTCDWHVQLLHDLADERGGVAALVPLTRGGVSR